MSEKELENNIILNKEVLEELTKGSDRSKVIVGATIIETLIERLLKKKLVQNNKLQKEAFDFTGFLGTFSSKINACYLLGLISKKLYNDIKRLKNLRNTFAHNLLNCDLENKDIKEEINKFKLLKDCLKSNWEKQSGESILILEISVLYVALTKKNVRTTSINKEEYEIGNLGFDDSDYEYLNTKL